MTSTSSSTKKVILAKSIDWDAWISFVRKRAKANRIWEYVDLSLTDKPGQPDHPQKPVLARLVGGGVDPMALEVYKLDIIEYKSELAEYERKEKNRIEEKKTATGQRTAADQQVT
ncbi:hypothetical protein MMC22_004511 [Lobaria immixta]|nr:hypothetical protein [Lobaria immixta]